MARNIESVFIEVINTGNVPTTQNISAHYGDDTDDSRLHLHLPMLGDLCRSAEPPVTLTVTGIADVVQLFTDNVVWLQLLPEVVSLNIAVSIPNFEPTTERNFSYLRRLKTFLRSTVTKKKLNHTAILHCHREQYVNLEDICNSFIIVQTWGTGIRGLMRGMATLPQGNQELLVVRGKAGRPPGELGVSKSMECDIFPSVL